MIFIVILIVTQNKKHNLYTGFISCSYLNISCSILLEIWADGDMFP